MKKIFVSSAQIELAEERAALTQALHSPEWDNFTFEWSGAFPDSARDVFLKQVGEADVYLGIFFAVYSQATVDEYHEARRLSMPILIYLKDCAEREPALTKFITEELYPAYKCQSFKTTDELVAHLPDIRRALDKKVQEYQRQAYLDALVAQTELLELAGIVDSGEQERPKLQEIFVALSAAEEVEERDERQSKDKRERERPIKTVRRVTINQALREHRHLMILGDPGAGKSTLLRYLTLVAARADMSLRAPQGRSNPQSTVEIASSRDPSTPASTSSASAQDALLAMTDGESRLPILIRLSSFARSGQSLVEYFETYAKTQLHVSLGAGFFERALEDGQAIVCLDGLDEVSLPAQRIEVRNAITALAARYPRNWFVVTSRVAGYDSASLDKRAFAHHTIVPFGEKEIQSFAEKWYAAREREPEQAKTRAANLFNDLKANERLLKLAENPLALTIIALVHQRAQGKLPVARVELYDRCAETLIEEWNKWKGLAPEDRERPYYRLRRRLLERAAYWMHIESQEVDVAQTSKRALEMKIAEFLVEDKTLNLSEDTARIEAKQFVALATNRTGILVEREQGAVSFIHLTFQEYFAASDLYWRYHRTPDALWQVIQPHLYDSRWLEVILLLLGRLKDDDDIPSILVQKILRKRDKFDELLHRNLFLAARCLADRVNVKETLRNEIVDLLLDIASGKQGLFHSLQWQAFQTLGTLSGDEHAADGVLALASDKGQDPLIRRGAAEALGRLGKIEEAVNLLLNIAQDIKIPFWGRGHAVSGLGQLAGIDPWATVALLTLGQDENLESRLRYESAEGLYRLQKHDEARQVLIVLLQNRKIHVAIRRDSARMLGKINASADVSTVILSEIAKDGSDNSEVRCECAIALGQLGQKDNAISLLLAFTNDKKLHAAFRLSVIQGLGQLGRVEDAGSLAANLAKDENIEIILRVYAAYTWAFFDYNQEPIQILLALAQEEKAGVGNDAVQALVELEKTDEEIIAALLTIVQNRKLSPGVRYRATLALGQLKYDDPNVVIHSLRVLAQNSKETSLVRLGAALALGGPHNSEIATNTLVSLLHSGRLDSWGYYYAAQGLAKSGISEDALDLLLALAVHKKVDSNVRANATRALGEWGKNNLRLCLALLKLTKDKDIGVRHAAGDALKDAVGNLKYYQAKIRAGKTERKSRQAVGRNLETLKQ